MSDITELLQLAAQLGQKTADHPRTARLRQAQNTIQNDPDAKALLDQYQLQANHIQQLESQQKPVEPHDKQKLAEIEQQIASNPNLVELTRRQVDFVEMMHQIKQAIDQKLQA